MRLRTHLHAIWGVALGFFLCYAAHGQVNPDPCKTLPEDPSLIPPEHRATVEKYGGYWQPEVPIVDGSGDEFVPAGGTTYGHSLGKGGEVEAKGTTICNNYLCDGATLDAWGSIELKFKWIKNPYAMCVECPAPSSKAHVESNLNNVEAQASAFTSTGIAMSDARATLTVTPTLENFHGSLPESTYWNSIAVSASALAQNQPGSPSTSAPPRQSKTRSLLGDTTQTSAFSIKLRGTAYASPRACGMPFPTSGSQAKSSATFDTPKVVITPELPM